MKKVILFFAGLALLTASCTKTEVVGNGAQENLKGIGFSAYTAKPTKAAQEDVTTSNLTSFNVSAIGNSAVYFDNVNFSKKESGFWESATKYFWPAYALNFYAWNVPVKGAFDSSIAVGSQTLTFTPSTTLSEQEDLVASKATNQTEPISGGTSLTFKHYLTQIVVKALNTNSTYDVKVDGVKIAHLDNTVEYNFASETSTVAGTATDQTYLNTFTTAKTLSDTATEVMTDGGEGRWYLVPQTVTKWNQATDKDNSSANTYLALKVKITANSGSLKVYPARGEESAWMAVPIAQEFKQGHKYTFIVKFFENDGAGYVDPEQPGELDGDAGTDDRGKSIIGGAIKFSVTDVEGWAPETEIVIEL